MPEDSPKLDARPGSANRRGDGRLTTGDMARLASSTLRTVRFYEEAGILEPLERTEGGHRLFAETEMQRLRLALDLRHADLSLEDVRALFGSKGEHASGAAAARAITEKLDAQLELVGAQLEQLQALAAELKATQEALKGCLACEKSELFPEKCGDCSVMRVQKSLPNALKVLWRVQT